MVKAHCIPEDPIMENFSIYLRKLAFGDKWESTHLSIYDDPQIVEGSFELDEDTGETWPTVNNFMVFKACRGKHEAEDRFITSMFLQSVSHFRETIESTVKGLALALDLLENGNG